MQKVRRMLELKAAGLGVREIARAVGSSPDTVSVECPGIAKPMWMHTAFNARPLSKTRE